MPKGWGKPRRRRRGKIWIERGQNIGRGRSRSRQITSRLAVRLRSRDTKRRKMWLMRTRKGSRGLTVREELPRAPHRNGGSMIMWRPRSILMITHYRVWTQSKVKLHHLLGRVRGISRKREIWKQKNLRMRERNRLTRFLFFTMT